MFKQLFQALQYSGAVGAKSLFKPHAMHASGTMKFQESECDGCRKCVEVCPVKALDIQIIPESWLIFRPERCIDCVRCVETCPKRVITFESLGRRFILAPFFRYQRLKKLPERERKIHDRTS